MDSEQVKAVCDEHNVAAVESLRSVVQERQLVLFDECVLQFVLKMLEGQMDPASYVDDTMIVQTLALYFQEFGVFKGEEEANKKARRVAAYMEEKGFAKKPAEEQVRLNAPLSIGKQYEDNLKRASMMGLGRVVVNTNDEWTWDTKRDAAKNERRRKKDEEKKVALQEEYEEFLKKRGVATSQKVIKLHNKMDGATYSTDIKCEGIHIRMGKNVLLDNTDLLLFTGHKYGLIGKNGAGKTTLLRALSERELEGVSPFVQILHVEQEITGTHDSPLQIVLDSDVERANLVREEQELLKSESEDAAARLAEVYQRMDEIDAHSAEARAAEILHGLSFTREMMTQPTKLLSGGWRMRVALARALFVEPEVLLLDEPTNHLDLHAVLWLEAFLQSWERTLVVVSHSRTFLDAVCTEVVHLENQKLTYYTGNYEQFETTRSERLRQQSKQYEAQEKQRSHMQAFVDRFRCNANRAKMAQSRLKALEKMELIGPVMEEAHFSFAFPEPEPAPTPYIQVIDCDFGYKPGVNLFSDVNISLDDESRVALVGANGAGKSTFIKICMNLLEPRRGTVIRNQKIRIGHFAQHHLESLTPQMSSLEFMKSKYPQTDEQQLRAHIGSLGLSGDKALQPIYTLSGGQKSRLALAWITYSKPHLLLLDEPTNHLDIDTVTALIQALLDFKGGLLVVSHDEHFITSLCDDIWVCANGKVQKFDGDFVEYKQSISRK